jgi:hypothetical protein
MVFLEQETIRVRANKKRICRIIMLYFVLSICEEKTYFMKKNQKRLFGFIAKRNIAFYIMYK